MPSSILPTSNPTSSAHPARHTSGPSSTTSATSHRPPPFPYLFRNLRDFPKRVLHPPSPPAPRVGTVRSFKLTPCYRVSLEDVINGRHLPPLGRKEFEDFLYFKEFSVENLYFHIWLLNYQAEWNQWAGTDFNASNSDSLKPNSKLAMSYARAKESFFTPGSHWELNLPQRMLRQLLHPQTPHPGPKSHPHPNAFAAVRFEVDSYLNDSLTRFIVQNGGNAGRHRGLFAVTLGTIVVGIGLLPIVLTSLGHDRTWHQKLIRLASIPALWLGFATLIAGLHGVCVLIFLFGDARQLYPYELRRPNITSPISYCPSLTLNPNLAANAAERQKQPPSGHGLGGGVAAEIDPSNHRPSLAALKLGNSETSAGRRASNVPVTISSPKENPDRIEFVQLPGAGRHRTNTATASETTFTPSDGHLNHRHTGSISKVDYESIGHLNFGLYEEGDDYSTKLSNYAEGQVVVLPTGDDTLEAQSATKMFPYHAASQYTPTATYATPLHLEIPIAFDFDSLPVPPTMRIPEWKASNPISATSSRETAPPFSLPYGAPNVYESSTSTNAKMTVYHSSTTGLRRRINAVKDWEWNKERTVFSPLTKVLDPIITRTQWEIVMRSCLVALAISLVVGLGSLGLP